MKILGAIIAGGEARRFGSDKGAALFNGRALVDHVALSLTVQTGALVIVGRGWSGIERVEDRPRAGEGPLGGLSGALHHARTHGFDAVLCAGCDTLPLPSDLAIRLSPPGPAVVDGHWLMGIWPASLAEDLDNWLASQNDRSIRGFMRHVNARIVTVDADLVNINTPEALAEAERLLGQG